MEAIIVNLLRIILSGFMFGNPFSIIYSLGGALVSFAVMLILYKSRLFSLTGISMAGGFSHNMGQLMVCAVFLSSKYVFWYAPWLMAAGIITGTLVGILSVEILKRIKNINSQIVES